MKNSNRLNDLVALLLTREIISDVYETAGVVHVSAGDWCLSISVLPTRCEGSAKKVGSNTPAYSVSFASAGSDLCEVADRVLEWIKTGV